MKSICNFGYARTKKGGAYFPDVRGLLKYLQYRDDRDDQHDAVLVFSDEGEHGMAGWVESWCEIEVWARGRRRIPAFPGC